VIVLSLFDRTTNMVKPWAEAGYESICVDWQHPPGESSGGENITLVGVDLCKWLPPRGEIAACFAFPPCTHLAVSGARWFRQKGLPSLAEGLMLVDRAHEICEWTGAPWFVENPVSVLSSWWRPPDYTFDPYEYGGYHEDGDAYTKKTCLWTGGGFTLPPPKPVEPVEGGKMWLMPPSDDRADKRSVTPMGFAWAVFHHMNKEYQPCSMTK